MSDTPRLSRSLMLPHYLVARNPGRGAELLLVSSEPGEEALVAFSSRRIAERFIRLRDLEKEWHARTSSPGETISLLCGLYIGVRWVSLNPLPTPLATEPDSLIMKAGKHTSTSFWDDQECAMPTLQPLANKDVQWRGR